MARRAYRRFSKEFKLEAIRLAEESGKPKAQVARELGIRVNQIGKWRKQLEEQPTEVSSDKGCHVERDDELKRLRHELADAREENDILKKPRLTLRETSGEVFVYLPASAQLLGASNVPGAECLPEWILRLGGSTGECPQSALPATDSIDPGVA